MKRHTLAALSLALAASGVLAQTAAKPVAAPARPQLPVPTAAQIAERCDKDLAAARAMLARIESGGVNRNVFRAMNELSMFIEDVSGPLYIIGNVSTDKATRDAADNCTVKYAPLETQIYQSERLFRRVKAAKPADAVERVYKQDLLDAFEDSGIALPPAKRKRVQAITEQMANIAKDFERNVREDGTKVPVTAEELAGTPQAVIDKLKKDDQGRLLVTLDYPTYIPIMELARNEGVRERVWRAKQSEGGAQNLKLLDQITELRQELAGLYGYPDFAALTLKRKMAGNPKAVMDFLASVRKATLEREKQDIDELRAFKAKTFGTPLDATRVNRWDVSFLQTALKKERYSVDNEALRKYFPTEASVRFMLRLSETLYGIRFEETKVPTWHPDVRVVNVFDAKSNAFIASIYLDLFPREGKYNHAAVWPVRNVSKLTGRTPIPVLVTNLNREGLDQNELETLLHEFGHALHGALSVARFNAQAGTSVKRDFVEAPSQMFEEWARREEPLKFFAQVCGPSCPVLSKEQIAQLDAARKFGAGLRYATQWVYASFDMALTHDRKDKTSLDAWKRIQGSTPLGYVEGTMFPAGFGHLVGGYAAGYYGYMWSEVLALDMLSAFGGSMLNQKVGGAYRQLILAPGAQRPPHELVEAFLGRKPNSDAFFAEISGKR